MRILHTSDWHLGRQLHQMPRDEEFAAFLEWMAATLEREAVDVLVIAGDVFDTATPSHRAQHQYYGFLAAARGSGCQHVVVIGGNHDSPTFLDAPSEALGALSVHVVGSPASDPASCLKVLESRDGSRLILCGVPYLRDGDVINALAGEAEDDREQRLREGIAGYYRRAAEAALAKRTELGGDIPVLATGHLFVTGGIQVEDDGVRTLYVGGLGDVSASAFPPVFDYVALGHIHRPQAFAGGRVRYSGAPLAMGFGEAGQAKCVHVVDLKAGGADVRDVPVPQTVRLVRLQGDLAALTSGLEGLSADPAALPAWVEATHTGHDLVPDLRERLAALVEGTPHQVLKVRDLKVLEAFQRSAVPEGTDLEDLGERQVFAHLLDERQIATEQRADLEACFEELLHGILNPGEASLA